MCRPDYILYEQFSVGTKKWLIILFSPLPTSSLFYLNFRFRITVLKLYCDQHLKHTEKPPPAELWNTQHYTSDLWHTTCPSIIMITSELPVLQWVPKICYSLDFICINALDIHFYESWCVFLTGTLVSWVRIQWVSAWVWASWTTPVM